MMQVWLLREAFLAYERLHGVYTSKEAAIAQSIEPIEDCWSTIVRKLPMPLFDDEDPFFSAPGAVCFKTKESLWIVEPRDAKS
jgi:hypothetical protein